MMYHTPALWALTMVMMHAKIAKKLLLKDLYANFDGLNEIVRK